MASRCRSSPCSATRRAPTFSPWARTAPSAPKRVDVVGTVGVNWAVNGGLADGDQVIVSGLQLAPPGSKVTPKPVDAPPDAPGLQAGRACARGR